MYIKSRAQRTAAEAAAGAGAGAGAAAGEATATSTHSQDGELVELCKACGVHKAVQEL